MVLWLARFVSLGCYFIERVELNYNSESTRKRMLIYLNRLCLASHIIMTS